MSSFEEGIHQMFDHIWDCEIDHPIFQDTVGELMQAVFQAYDSIKPMKWIPCSERLPEAGVSVIVTSKGGYVYTSNIAHGEWEYGGDVIAWMPLPEPWKGADGCSSK